MCKASSLSHDGTAWKDQIATLPSDVRVHERKKDLLDELCFTKPEENTETVVSGYSPGQLRCLLVVLAMDGIPVLVSQRVSNRDILMADLSECPGTRVGFAWNRCLQDLAIRSTGDHGKVHK